MTLAAMDANTPTQTSGLGLRTKLSLGFVLLLAVLIAVGVQSISLLDELGGSIDVILRENYRSVIASERMKEALERMDSGALFSLAGEPQQGRAIAEQNHPRFDEALKTELGNVTLPGEGERAQRLKQLYATYEPVLERVLDPNVPLEERRGLYFQRLFPIFQQIKGTADEVLNLNQRNMVDANDRARKLAKDATLEMALLLLAGTAIAGLGILFLSRAMMGPRERLPQAMSEVRNGRFQGTVPVTSQDELGQLATAFNFMAGGLQDLREPDRAHLLSAWRSSQLARDSLPRPPALKESDHELHLEPVPAGDLVAAAVRDIAPRYQEKQVTLTAEVDPEAPRVLADRKRARLLLPALLRNALAHTPAGGAVTVRVEPWEGRTRFTVTDTGSGVPATYRAAIFEPLGQVPGTQDLGSVGLGLAISRDIVHSHGGEIHCESEESRGATFWFTLPAAAD